MSKKMKLNLDSFKVQSFVTSLYRDTTNKLKGGITQGGVVPECPENVPTTPDTNTGGVSGANTDHNITCPGVSAGQTDCALQCPTELPGPGC